LRCSDGDCLFTISVTNGSEKRIVGTKFVMIKLK
ncbi:unnamed protein product, partial [Amoebophrya sp. A120]